MDLSSDVHLSDEHDPARSSTPASNPYLESGPDWTRTSDLFRVEEAL